jgi:hypothetical protein
MPIQKIKGGYRWGRRGKIYRGNKARQKALKQGRAIAMRRRSHNRK